MAPDPEAVFRSHVPAQAVSYCVTLQKVYGFSLRASKPRRSKWGDYRYRRAGGRVQHAISVNDDLNPYAFLITYLHEVAHLRAFQQHGFRIPPHGAAWKQCFRQLLVPVLSATVFPSELLVAVRQFARNPRASTGADVLLTQALQPFNSPTNQVPLGCLSEGKRFTFRERTYVKQKTRRTRALCEEVRSRKQYLILETTLVDLLD
ncbi:MAG: SprT-like domain-containing protein [Tunicatimonas sp.]